MEMQQPNKQQEAAPAFSESATAGDDNVGPASPVDALPAPGATEESSHMTPVQFVTVTLGGIALLYFGRPVILPVVLACVAGMALKPLIRWLSNHYIPPAVASALMLPLLIAGIAVGFLQLVQPAVTWVNDLPEHAVKIRERAQTMVPRFARLSRAATAFSNIGTTEEERAKVTTVELTTSRVPGTVINWTGTLLAGAGETLVLLYLLLASGDLFLQKLVHVMPTLHDKKRAVEISHEIQLNISNYLLTVSLINVALGVVSTGVFHLMGVPEAAMWGMFVAVLNFVPYFGPVVGVILLATVGLLTFDTLWRVFLPPGCYLALHLLESNLLTPILLGRKFTLNPVVIFVSLIFWTWLWGVPGALLSAPLLVSIKVVCDRFPRMASVSELLSS